MGVNLREKKLAKGKKSFYLDVYFKGIRRKENINIYIYPKDSSIEREEKRRIAQIMRSQREIELSSKGIDYLPEHLKKINFFDFANSYIRNYKKADIGMIDGAKKQFQNFVDNDKLLISEIDENLMDGFKDYLINDAGLTGETPHNYFTRFKKILNNAKSQGYINKNPADKIKFKKRSSSQNLKKLVLTNEELQILAQSKSNYPDLKKAFIFACYTGLGLIEIKNLKHVDIRNNKLSTNRSKSKEPVNLKIRESLLQYVGHSSNEKGKLFDLTNDKGEPLTNNGANHRLEKWLSKVGIDKHITFYCARHTFATQLLLNGANLKTVAKAMGHTTVRSTEKYLNYINNLTDDAVENLPELKF